MMKRHAIATAILLCTSPLFVAPDAVASTATFVGSVKDSQSHLSGALITVVGTDKSTVTNYQGQFELPQLNPGNYQLKITYLGYQPYFVDITVGEGVIKKLKPITLFAANNDSAIEEIIAVGQIQRGAMAAANNQKNAKSIKNIISADGIGKLPDRNAAEAVQRIPGVSIERDQGEGRFVAVRGLPAQWSSASINGDRLPTAEEETTSRATAFDFFPSELIEFVEVSKALTPDLEGDAIGDNVNFITKKAPDDFVLNTNFAIGQNELADGTNYSANLLYGDRLLDDK
ncbi:carboxypeptidase-like regulatory domain-containing protein, partial [Pseudoalteromonas sp.]|uniref:carboxypeptidase-like regulatory domain-containing protein n=1 Tax=Pseudoalteromonas sp. TaxID=53249 RepID=UPI0035684A79